MKATTKLSAKEVGELIVEALNARGIKATGEVKLLAAIVQEEYYGRSDPYAEFSVAEVEIEVGAK